MSDLIDRQPTQKNDSNTLEALNCVSRQAVIDATWEEPTYSDPLNVLTEVRDRLKGLPSAQPEIIKCKDCTAYGEMLIGRDTRMICHKFALNFPRDFFCADAERRRDE